MKIPNTSSTSSPASENANASNIKNAINKTDPPKTKETIPNLTADAFLIDVKT